MQRPLLSIIITVLNGQETIADCLKSIDRQSFTGYEVVIIDGGSSDGTVDIINSSRVNGLTLEIMPGIGLYAGLNAGIDKAIGEWMYFMGCDDQLFDLSTLSKVSKILRETSDKIVCGSVKYTSGFVLKPILYSPILTKYVHHHQGTFYQRQLFDTYRYNEKLFIASDYELNIKLKLDGYSCTVIQDIVALYGEEGISSVQYKKNFEEVVHINRRLFLGLNKYVVLTFQYAKHYIWVSRKKSGMLNLTHKVDKMIEKIRGLTASKQSTWNE